MMQWVSSGRFGTWLALSALALQIILTFGHVHLDDVHPVAAVHAKAGVGGTQVSQQMPAPLSDDDDGYCALCASIFLASTIFVPLAPPLPLPPSSKPTEQSLKINSGFIIQPRRVAFQSRAPPRA